MGEEDPEVVVGIERLPYCLWFSKIYHLQRITVRPSDHISFVLSGKPSSTYMVSTSRDGHYFAV